MTSDPAAGPPRPRGPDDARSDEDLLGTYADRERARDERETAFRVLADRYRRRVFAVCYRVLGSAADAEDATQETLVKLARGADGFRGEAKLSTWLYRVARNVCTDRVRYEARRPSTPVEDVEVVAAPGVEDATEAHATASVVSAALGELDGRSRQLLLLVAVDGLSYAEAAEVTGLAVGTVKSRVSRARATLGQLLSTDDEVVAPTTRERGPVGEGPRAGRRRGPRGPPGSSARSSDT